MFVVGSRLWGLSRGRVQWQLCCCWLVKRMEVEEAMAKSEVAWQKEIDDYYECQKKEVLKIPDEVYEKYGVYWHVQFCCLRLYALMEQVIAYYVKFLCEHEHVTGTLALDKDLDEVLVDESRKCGMKLRAWHVLDPAGSVIRVRRLSLLFIDFLRMLDMHVRAVHRCVIGHGKGTIGFTVSATVVPSEVSVWKAFDQVEQQLADCDDNALASQRLGGALCGQWQSVEEREGETLGKLIWSALSFPAVVKVSRVLAWNGEDGLVLRWREDQPCQNWIGRFEKYVTIDESGETVESWFLGGRRGDEVLVRLFNAMLTGAESHVKVPMESAGQVDKFVWAYVSGLFVRKVLFFVTAEEKGAAGESNGLWWLVAACHDGAGMKVLSSDDAVRAGYLSGETLSSPRIQAFCCRWMDARMTEWVMDKDFRCLVTKATTEVMMFGTLGKQMLRKLSVCDTELARVFLSRVLVWDGLKTLALRWRTSVEGEHGQPVLQHVHVMNVGLFSKVATADATGARWAIDGRTGKDVLVMLVEHMMCQEETRVATELGRSVSEVENVLRLYLSGLNVQRRPYRVMFFVTLATQHSWEHGGWWLVSYSCGTDEISILSSDDVVAAGYQASKEDEGVLFSRSKAFCCQWMNERLSEWVEELGS